MKKIVSVFLIVLLLSVSLSPLTLARASDQIDSYGISLSTQGSGKIKVVVDIGGTHRQMTKIGFPSIGLYEQNGTVWTPVYSAGSQYNSNNPAGSHSYTFTYQGVAGKKYYAAASFYAQDANGSDLRSANSPTVTAT